MRLSAITAALLIFSSQATGQTLPGCKSAPGGLKIDRMGKANAALARRFHDAINRQDWQAADSLVSANYRHYVTSADGFRAVSWDAFKRGNQHLRTAFPDWTNDIVQTIAERDKVAVILQGHGTHRGSVAGEAATGRAATLPIMIVHQICAGKLVADWEFVDTGPLMASLTKP